MANKDIFLRIAGEIAGDRVTALNDNEDGMSLVLDVSGLAVDQRNAMEAALRHDLSSAGAGSVRIVMTAEKNRPDLIAVASGKGGVGKSTLSTNLAISMKKIGRNAGLVDADIYGPSQPRLLGREGIQPEAQDKKMIPVIGAGDVPFLSMGQLVKPGQAVAWRGPMAGNALSQLVDASWGTTGEIIVDMPPGTGDIQLSMIQKHKPVGAVIISTPQDLALIDAARAISFFDTANVPIIGIVENMAGYLCPHCGEISEPFGHGGAEAAAKELGIDFLGRIPLDISIRIASDAGEPPALGDGLIAQSYMSIAQKLATWLDNRKNASA